jgi:hypothetical protein
MACFLWRFSGWASPLLVRALVVLRASRVSARRPTHFLLLRQEKVSKEKATRWSGSPALRSGATCGAHRKRGRARTRCAQTIARPDPLSAALLGPARRVGKRRQIPMSNAGSPDARSASGQSQATLLFARGSSTRSQMKSPSIAQRGEGGVRGGSGELRLLSQANRERSVMPARENSRRFSSTTQSNPHTAASPLPARCP